MKNILLKLFVFYCLSLFGAAAVATNVIAQKLSTQTIFPLPNDWYPESLAAGPEGIYVGSWRQGAVALLRPHNPNPEIFIAPGSNGLTNAQGLLVDTRRGLLWVCSGDMGYTTVPRHPSALLAFDLKTGKSKQRYELPGGGYCNDLAMDSHQNIYVTDSLHPRVLRVSFDVKQLEVWKEDVAFEKGLEGFFLNGIAIDQNDVMYLSAVTAVPFLYRVSIQQQSTEKNVKPTLPVAGVVEKIVFNRTLKNADAIRSISGDKLIIFESNAFGGAAAYGGQISIANLIDLSVTPVVAGLNDPSSGIIMDNRIYFIESKYQLLLRETPDVTSRVPLNVPFEVQSQQLPD